MTLTKHTQPWRALQDPTYSIAISSEKTHVLPPEPGCQSGHTPRFTASILTNLAERSRSWLSISTLFADPPWRPSSIFISIFWLKDLPSFEKVTRASVGKNIHEPCDSRNPIEIFDIFSTFKRSMVTSMFSFCHPCQ